MRSLTIGNCKNTHISRRRFDSVTYKVFRKAFDTDTCKILMEKLLLCELDVPGEVG